MRLKGIDPGYNTLKEAYFLTALAKQKRVEAKMVGAIAIAAFANKPESVREALNSYLEEMFPDIAESRGAFVEFGKQILEREAGRVITLSGIPTE